MIFVCLGGPKSEECHQALAVLLSVCSESQILVAQEKTEGPLVVLVIEVDTMTMQLRQPADSMTEANNC